MQLDPGHVGGNEMKDPHWWPTGSITIRTEHFTDADHERLLAALTAMLRFTRWQRFKGWLSDLWAKVW